MAMRDICRTWPRPAAAPRPKRRCPSRGVAPDRSQVLSVATLGDAARAAAGRPGGIAMPSVRTGHARYQPRPRPARPYPRHSGFPETGILFYDISTLLRHGPAWRAAMARLAAIIRPYKPDLLAGIESRGFLVAAPLALELGLGFVMLRKPRKLPGRPSGSTMRWNTAPTGSRCRPMRWCPASAWCCWTTCWPPAGRCRRASACCGRRAPRCRPSRR